MEDIEEIVLINRLQDLGYRGLCFTWCNRREGNEYINERLDRFLATSEWSQIFLDSSVVHDFAAYLNHRPIWINTEGQGRLIRGRRTFRFESIWVG